MKSTKKKKKTQKKKSGVGGGEDGDCTGGGVSAGLEWGVGKKGGSQLAMGHGGQGRG